MHRRGWPLIGVLAGCGGGGVASPHDAGADDAAVDDAAVVPDGGFPGFTPDPVTMGEDLPPEIPVMHIDVGGAQIQLDVVVPGTITVTESGVETLSSAAGVQGRGNFTWSLPKKGYAFDLGTDQALLGMPPGTDFALYACYTDKTCLRDALVYAIGQQLGRWSPRTRFVELYLDGAYEGLYMVWERIRRDAQRVALPKDTGYIVRHEGGPEGDGSDFQTTNSTWYRYHYPRPEVITAADQQYVQDTWQAMEDALVADPAGHAAVIDETSWADRAIVEEVTNNWDGYVHSIYMDVDAADGRVVMGPLWDYDLAFGNGNVTGYNCQTDNWAYQIQRGYPDNVPDYWLALWADPGFQHAWKCRYQALRGDAIADATFDARIDAWVAFTADARARDQARWPTIGTPVFPNCTTEPSYDAEITYLRGFIHDRLAWLDAQALAIPGDCP